MTQNQDTIRTPGRTRVQTTTLLRAGDVIGGFRIDDVIGIGGMAIVYRAEQISLNRPVALKVLSSKLTSDVVFRERFRREGTHAAGLEHPNIVPVYDSGEQDGNLYIAMRLIEGTNLAELIETRGLTADQTIELLRPIASALDTAHAAGLIHRDVKPQNILISSHAHPYLADFGVAKGSNTEGLTATGGFIGSIHYASPEQIKGLTLTPASDVYGLTAVLYQCLTGRVPFPRETDAGVMHAHLHDPPPTLPTTTGADSDFHTVIARGMAKDSGARYGHAGDLVNAAALCVSRLPAESRTTVPAFPEPRLDPEPEEDPAEAPRDATEIVPPDQFAALRAAASLTHADRRRPEPPEPPVEKAAGARMPRGPVVGVTIALAVAAVIGVLVTTGSRSAHASTFRSGHLVLSAGSNWRRGTASIVGLPLSKPVAISTGGAGVVAGALSRAAAIPGSPPATLTAQDGKPAQTSAVTLPLGQAKSYTWPSAASGPLTLLLVATERGEIAIACTAATAARLSSMESTCNSIRADARLVDTRVEYPGPDPRVASQLSATLSVRAGAIAKVSRTANGSHLPLRAGGLKAFAAKDEQTIHSVAGISTPPHDVAAITALLKGLEREVTLVRALSGAASRDNAVLYDAIRGQLMAAGITDAATGLAAVGFTGLPLPAIDLTRAPSPPHHRTAQLVTPAPTPGPVVASQPSQLEYTAPSTSAPAPSPAPKEKEEEFVTKAQ